MKHVINTHMFGNFRMEYDGKPLIAERMHRDGQFVRMMHIILYYAQEGISKDKLEEYVVGEMEMSEPHTALRVIVYKVKKKLEQLGVQGKDIIYLKNGMYYLTDDIEVKSDVKDFIRIYDQIRLLDNAVDRDTDELVGLCREAIYLYKGDFLQNYIAESWVAQNARYYREIFENCVEILAEQLRKKNDWKKLRKLGEYAAKAEPFCNWEGLVMEAVVKSGHHQEAVKYYDEVVDNYLDECGIYPSTRLLELLDSHTIEGIHADNILENIQEEILTDSNQQKGAFFCSYPIFRAIYQFTIRSKDRYQYVTYLMLCSLVDENGKMVSDKHKTESLMEVLKEIIKGAIRQNDVFMRYSKSQYLLLLLLNEEENAELVETRINQAFMKKQEEKTKCLVNCTFVKI